MTLLLDIPAAIYERWERVLGALKYYRNKGLAAEISAVFKTPVQDLILRKLRTNEAATENGGTLEVAQRIAGHADSRTTKLYGRCGQKVLLEDMDSILKLLDLWHSYDTKLRSRNDSRAPFQEYPFLSSNVPDYLTIFDDNFLHPALHFGAVEVFNSGYITIFVTNILRRFPSPP